MLAELRRTRFPLETALLVALAIFLPLVEAPKNLAWLGYAGAWCANRARAQDFGGRWNLWDTLIVLWIASGFLAAAFAGLHQSEWRGAKDLLRYGSLLWMVKRGGYTDRELRWVLGALAASTVAGLTFGYWRIWSGAGKSGTLQLHSVGHVNHTAIYLAIMLGVCTAWIFARWRAWRAGRKAVAAAVAILVLVSLLVSASRGAVAAGLAAVLLLALLWWPRWRIPFVVSLAGAAVVVAAMVGFGSELMRKHETWAAKDNVLSSRDAIWRMGLAAWQRYPWFGVGMDNYSLISHESVRAWRSEAGEDYDEQRYLPNAHAHSLYVNTLTERGVVGALALAAVLVTWLAWLLRYRPRPGDGDEAWRLWGGSAAAWWVTVSMGSVNTTLHHEHGILAALLLGMWLSWLARHRAS